MAFFRFLKSESHCLCVFNFYFAFEGGVEVVCRNFVNCNSRIISTSPSLISTIMQNMNGQANTDKRKKWESESTEGVQNFAPLGIGYNSIYTVLITVLIIKINDGKMIMNCYIVSDCKNVLIL